MSAPGISEDIALLLAHERGAELIVAVGTHFNLVEFMERNRAGMASTFVTRLKVGESPVDAKGVSRLVSPRIGIWPLVTFAVAGITAVVVAVLVSPALRNVIQSLRRSIGNSLGLCAALLPLAVATAAPTLLLMFDLATTWPPSTAVFVGARDRDPGRGRPLGKGSSTTPSVRT